MSRLLIDEGLLREALAALRTCGAGRRECVVYLTGRIDRPGEVDAVVHPEHTASVGGYQVDDAWLNRQWLELAAERRTIRAQVHTHPGAAYHSTTDDEFPTVQTPGFLSLVIPRFARAKDLAGAYLAELDETGRFQTVGVDERLVVA